MACSFAPGWSFFNLIQHVFPLNLGHGFDCWLYKTFTGGYFIYSLWYVIDGSPYLNSLNETLGFQGFYFYQKLFKILRFSLMFKMVVLAEFLTVTGTYVVIYNLNYSNFSVKLTNCPCCWII